MIYPINHELREYLAEYDRTISTPISYEDLLRFTDSYPILDKDGKETLWDGVMYSHYEMDEIHQGLIKIYQRLRSDGNREATTHLIVDSIDFCTFGNTHPFRIKIRNLHNDIHDYFYVKKADASRIYGLELEHLLSPNRIDFLVHKNTLIEEHVSGIPGDIFLEKYLDENQSRKRIAKEFVKFNERCFLRLLGDQRSYNFVMVLTPDFDEIKYRIRSIDFDQQSYEGRMNLYKPQFYKENLQYVKFVMDYIDESSIRQYQHEERSLMAKRLLVGNIRIKKLIEIMKKDEIAPKEKVVQLREEIHQYLKDNNFKSCETMGDIVEAVLNFTLRNYESSVTGK
ncbi:hypothetical protein [uncultured Chryseobacterium sp.]|uniref:hypothetical protein n=1 Tax=uncultured Chryseobacterium sp. TaxID=259322 RepID=UPI00345BE537